ncbi:MAG: hypothetical protein AB7H77_03150 [Bdellovibrionales bacterium]
MAALRTSFPIVATYSGLRQGHITGGAAIRATDDPSRITGAPGLRPANTRAEGISQNTAISESEKERRKRAFLENHPLNYKPRWPPVIWAQAVKSGNGITTRNIQAELAKRALSKDTPAPVDEASPHTSPSVTNHDLPSPEASSDRSFYHFVSQLRTRKLPHGYSKDCTSLPMKAAEAIGRHHAQRKNLEKMQKRARQMYPSSSL